MMLATVDSKYISKHCVGKVGKYFALCKRQILIALFR